MQRPSSPRALPVGPCHLSGEAFSPTPARAPAPVARAMSPCAQAPGKLATQLKEGGIAMRRTIAAVVLVALASAVSASADPLVVLGKGRAPIEGGRLLDARGQALSAALHDALYKGAARIWGMDSGDLSDDQIESIETAWGDRIQ